MRFNAAAFDRFLGDIGQSVLWRQSFSCACVDRRSGNPDPKHALCQGKGRLWNPPIETVTGIASQKVEAEWAQSGLWESGDMVLSIPQSSQLWDAGQFDRVTMLNSTDVFSQPLVRGDVTERLLFQPVSIMRCFWLSPEDRNVIVEGRPPVVDVNGNLSWTGGLGEPPPGIIYSLTGTKNSEYYIFGAFPSDRNQHQGMRLPKKVVARKWDLFAR